MLIAFVCPVKAVKNKFLSGGKRCAPLYCRVLVMSLRKILENLTFTSSTFDQKYVHACPASPAPFTVIFHGFF